jgi:hypothetical protein
MLAPFRLTRLITIALAACAVTWAMVGTAFALPVHPPPRVESTGAAPPYKAVVGDRKEPETSSAPAFKVVAGDVKEPQAANRPAFEPVVGDVKSDADRARATAPVFPRQPGRPIVPAASDDHTGTVALVLSIAALLTAAGAVTLTVTRPSRGTMHA